MTPCARCRDGKAEVRLTRYSESLADTAWLWQRKPLCRHCAEAELQSIETESELRIETELLDD